MMEEAKSDANHAHLGLGELESWGSDEAGQVVLHVLEDEVQALRHARCYDPFQLYDVRVIQSPKNVDLPSHEAHAFGVHVHKPHLLQRDHLPGIKVPGFIHDAVGPLPNLQV
jgi:hypothetical protein